MDIELGFVLLLLIGTVAVLTIFFVRFFAKKDNKESEGHLKAVLDTVIDGIITIDDKGVIQAFNPAAEHIFGYSSSEVIGRNVSMLMPDPYHKEHDQYIMNYLNTGDAQIIGIGREVKARHRDGRVFPMELGISNLQVGNEKLFVGIVRDISERKKAERNLEDSTQRLEAVLNTVIDGIITISDRGYITAFNPAAERIFGYDAEEVLYQNVKMLMPDPYHKEHDGYINNYLETRKAKVIGIGREVEALRKDGTTFPMELGVSEITISGERMFVGIIRNISERKEAEAKVMEYAQELELKTIEAEKSKLDAEQANNMKSEFLANMSHEIRTPMNGVIGMTSLLMETDLTEEQEGRVEIIRNSGEALLSIINDILDLSKIESGKLELEVVDFNLNLLVMELSDIFITKCKDKGVELIIRYSPDTVEFIKGDPGRIRQVLMNLIGNSIKFTSEGYILLNIETKKITKDEVTLLFEVQDTGTGILQDKQDHIFESFSQEDATITRQYGGTGLGLTISKQLVNMMGGEIGVKSSIGHGSTFWLRASFPLSEMQDAQKVNVLDLSKAKVLIVDNLKINRQILNEYIKVTNAKIDMVETEDKVVDALRKAQKNKKPYDALFFGHNLPDFDGISLSKEIFDDKSLKSTSLFMLPSSNMHNDIEDIKKLGISGYLEKPFYSKVLYQMLPLIWSGKEGNKKIDLVTRYSVNAKSKKPKYRRLKFNAHVLVAEDNPTNKLMIVQILELLGCRVDVAGNGREAVDMYKQIDYDVILMDCQMPEMSGYEATGEIRKLEGKNRKSIIIALTANALAGDREKCIKSGMDDYLSKPIRKEDLQQMLSKWIAEEVLEMA